MANDVILQNEFKELEVVGCHILALYQGLLVLQSASIASRVQPVLMAPLIELIQQIFLNRFHALHKRLVVLLGIKSVLKPNTPEHLVLQNIEI